MSPHFQTPLLVPLYLPLMISTVVLLLSSSPLKLKAEVVTPIARRGCPDTCGNVSIPFPWGIGTGCFLDNWFEINCKASPLPNGSTKPFLSKLGVEVVEIHIVFQIEDGFSEEYQELIVRIPPMNVCTTDTQHDQPLSGIDLRGGPYNLSAEDNVFVMEGCSGSAVLVDESNTTVAGCATICNNSNAAMNSSNCFGVKCCQSPLPGGLQFYNLDFNLPSSGESGQNCLLVALINSYSLDHYVGKLSTSDPSGAAPVSLSWSWISNIHPDINPHASCDSDAYYNSTRCRCNEGSVGNNPYVFGGCQIAEACKGCRGQCYYSPFYKSYRCDEPPRFSLAAILGFSIGLGVIALVISCYGLYRFIKRRREMKRRAKYFKRNGGLLLEQQLSSTEGVIERTKIFTSNELEKGTDHFNKNRILGQGGQGTVYKGMLSDGRIVAIKKSKLIDESQLEQFINEVVILSQINHRHVVKLLGCCLETEVPLLVYEFISNGTLSEHKLGF